MEYLPELNVVVMSLVDLEHCGFDHGLFDFELDCRGIKNQWARWPTMLAIDFAGGCVVTDETTVKTLEVMGEQSNKFREYLIRIRNPGYTATALSNKELLEKLARIEHDQWVYWSKTLAHEESGLSTERLKRWRELWDTDYVKLTEKVKNSDRMWARQVIETVAAHLSSDSAQHGFMTYGVRK